jgi:CubicO group peptidase (beta-lactamase class C family)
MIFSVSKSIAGTLGAVLADCGKLDPDALVTRYIPEMEG